VNCSGNRSASCEVVTWAIWRRLAAGDVVIEEEPKRKPWGLIEMVARDPDGLAIVIVEVPSGHPQRRAA